MPSNNVQDTHGNGASSDTRSPVANLHAIDFSVDTALAAVSTVLLVITAGTIVVDMLGVGSQISLTLPTGYHPLRITKVYNSGSATLVGFYGW